MEITLPYNNITYVYMQKQIHHVLISLVMLIVVIDLFSKDYLCYNVTL